MIYKNSNHFHVLMKMDKNSYLDLKKSNQLLKNKN